MTMSLPKRLMSANGWDWKVLKVTFNSSVETALGYILEKNELVKFETFCIYVQTAESGKTIDVGLKYSENSNGGDANGFIAAVSLTTVGYVFPAATVAQGTNANRITPTTIGAYFTKGSDGANVSGQNAVPIYGNHKGDGVQKTMTYTCSSATASFVGFVCFQTMKLPDLTNFLLH